MREIDEGIRGIITLSTAILRIPRRHRGSISAFSPYKERSSRSGPSHTVNGSNRPILANQSRDAAEILQITRDDNGVTFQRDGGDGEIGLSDVELLRLKLTGAEDGGSWYETIGSLEKKRRCRGSCQLGVDKGTGIVGNGGGGRSRWFVAGNVRKKSSIFCAVVSQTYGTIRHVKIGCDNRFSRHE